MNEEGGIGRAAVSTIARDGTMWTLERAGDGAAGERWTLADSAGHRWVLDLPAWDESALTSWLAESAGRPVAETLAQSFRPEP